MRIVLVLFIFPIFTAASGPDECKRKDPASATNSDFAAETGRVSDCIRKRMNSELDKRLLVLKRENPGQYKTEMKLQEKFNAAAEAFNVKMKGLCEGKECQALCDFRHSLNEYRQRQAELINRKELAAVSSVEAPLKVSREIDKGFRPFARELCKMPPDVWKERAAPKECEKAILSELAHKLEFVSAEEDSCGVLAR